MRPRRATDGRDVEVEVEEQGEEGACRERASTLLMGLRVLRERG
jgi:hypothetical protein